MPSCFHECVRATLDSCFVGKVNALMSSFSEELGGSNFSEKIFDKSFRESKIRNYMRKAYFLLILENESQTQDIKQKMFFFSYQK